MKFAKSLQKKVFDRTCGGPPPLAVIGHSDFMQVLLTCINIYVFEK